VQAVTEPPNTEAGKTLGSELERLEREARALRWPWRSLALRKVRKLREYVDRRRDESFLRRCSDCGELSDYQMTDGSWICHNCGSVS
jgi:hypothetical protein